MSRPCRLTVLSKGLAVLLPALLSGGCEIDGQGGDKNVRWALSSNPGGTASNATAQIDVAGDKASTSVRLP